jgi:hypothetical protein
MLLPVPGANPTTMTMCTPGTFMCTGAAAFVCTFAGNLQWAF